MKKLILSGWNGRMGKSVSLAAPEYGFRTVAGIGHGAKEANGTVTFPVYAHTADCRERADCVIDFSSPSFLPELLAFADKSHTPLVIGTTGYSEKEKAKIEEFSHRVPVFCSPNLSFGIGVLQKLCRTLPSLLGQEFDIEMTEIHHKKKKTRPAARRFYWLRHSLTEEPRQSVLAEKEKKYGNGVRFVCTLFAAAGSSESIAYTSWEKTKCSR